MLKDGRLLIAHAEPVLEQREGRGEDQISVRITWASSKPRASRTLCRHWPPTPTDHRPPRQEESLQLYAGPPWALPFQDAEIGLQGTSTIVPTLQLTGIGDQAHAAATAARFLKYASPPKPHEFNWDASGPTLRPALEVKGSVGQGVRPPANTPALLCVNPQQGEALGTGNARDIPPWLEFEVNILIN